MHSLGCALSKCIATLRIEANGTCVSLALPGRLFSTLNSPYREAGARLCADYVARRYAVSHLSASERASRVSYFNRSLPPSAEFRVSRSRRKNYSMACPVSGGFNRTLYTDTAGTHEKSFDCIHSLQSLLDRFFRDHAYKLTFRS